jgi:hypothetical protein
VDVAVPPKLRAMMKHSPKNNLIRDLGWSLCFMAFVGWVTKDLIKDKDWGGSFHYTFPSYTLFFKESYIKLP